VRLAAAVAALAVVGVLGGCGGNVVQLPDCIDCRPVTMGMDQVLEVPLGSDRTVANPEDYAWVIEDLGTMELVSEEQGTRQEDPAEFPGGVSSYVLWTLAPTQPGATEATFAYLRTDDPAAAPGLTIVIEIIVEE
jgi:hypothetical protein